MNPPTSADVNNNSNHANGNSTNARSTSNPPNSNSAAAQLNQNPLDPGNNSSNKATIIGLIILAMLVIALFIYIPHSSSKKPHTQSLPVVTAVAETHDVPVYLTALGTVTSPDSITVKTTVNGIMQTVNYTEGQLVKTGDVLAQIDPRPFQAQVLQFEGQLERDQALLANARVDLKRFQTLYKQNSVAQQTLATQAALVNQLDGTVKLDQGQLNNAQVNLGYCTITSPIDGRVGLRLVDPGNYVQTSDTTGIVVVNTVNPITVVFTIPEDNVSQVITQIYGGKTLPVQAYDRTQSQLLDTGKLLTIDNQIDPTTGTVKLKAIFDNHNYLLFPNEFVNIKLQIDTLHNAVLVPTAAIQQGTQGPYVYLLNTDQTVSIKPVVTGITINNDTTVTSGVLNRQIVVVEGADKLTDGASVNVYNAAATAQPGKTHNKTHHRPDAA